MKNNEEPKLTSALLEDLFNPSLTTLDLCQLHDLSLAELADILESDTYQQAAADFARISTARQQLLTDESQSLAAARLNDLLKDKPETPAHAETQRKAANTLFNPPKRRSAVKFLRNTSFAIKQNENRVSCQSSVHKSARLSLSNLQSRDHTMLKHAIVLTAATTAAHAQSFNIEWGTPESAPPSTYAAQGLPGVWNTFSEMIPVQRYPLVGLDGQPIAADIMNIGFDTVESFDNPAIVDDDAALLDDCFTSFNDPIDGCLFMRFLEPGEYRVIMYALASDDESLQSRLRIDQNTQDPELVGGIWTGAHENGISFMMQTANVKADGRLDLHSGLPSANIRSVLNGIQVIRLADLCPADLNLDTVLDIFDVLAFIDAFNAENPGVDFTDDGVFDVFDVLSFIEAFNAGCP